MYFSWVARRENSERSALLLDVHVVGVEMHEHFVATDPLHEIDRLLSRIDDMIFVPVDRYLLAAATARSAASRVQPIAHMLV